MPTTPQSSSFTPPREDSGGSFARRKGRRRVDPGGHSVVRLVGVDPETRSGRTGAPLFGYLRVRGRRVVLLRLAPRTRVEGPLPDHDVLTPDLRQTERELCLLSSPSER